MLTAGIALTSMGESIGTSLGQLMRSALTIPRGRLLDAATLTHSFADLAMQALLAIAPVLLLTMVAAVGAPLALGGWSFSGTALTPDFSRLNPLAGIGRMFALRSWVELGKALAKFGIVGIAAWLVLRNNLDALLGLGMQSVDVAIGQAMALAGKALILLTASLILIAAVDVPFQL